MGEYESNIDNILAEFQSKVKNINDNKAMIREIATTLYGNISHRVHNDGKDATENEIGRYSTKPTLIGAKSFVNKTAANKVFGSKAKRKALTWVTVKGHSLAELQGGYKQIRSIEGKETNHVNLDRTGKLRKDFGFAAQGKDYVIGFKSEYGAKLRKYQEDHWGKVIWQASEKDKQIAVEIFERYIQKQLNA